MKFNITFLLIMLAMPIFAQQGWQYQNSSLTTNESGAIYALSKDSVFVIADHGVFSKSYDGGSSWGNVYTGFTESFFDIIFINADTGYCAGKNGKIIKTIDGGDNWTALMTGTTKNIFSLSIPSANNIRAVGDSGIILHSNDFGINWDLQSIVDKRLNSIVFKDSIGIIVGNEGTILKSINAGTNWTIENAGTSNDLFSLCMTQNYVYALSGWIFGELDSHCYYDAAEIIKSDDYTNWTTTFVGSGIPGLSRMFFTNDSTGFNISSNCTTNGDCGIHIQKSCDYASNWNLSYLNWNPPSAWVGIEYADLFFVNDTIGYALSGNNILKTSDGGLLVNMNEISDNQMIRMYPNPLTSDILTFETNNISSVELEIYDLSGHLLIKSILSNTQENLYLSNLNNGIYLVKLFQGSIVLETKKLIIIK